MKALRSPVVKKITDFVSATVFLTYLIMEIKFLLYSASNDLWNCVSMDCLLGKYNSEVKALVKKYFSKICFYSLIFPSPHSLLRSHSQMTWLVFES